MYSPSIYLYSPSIKAYMYVSKFINTDTKVRSYSAFITAAKPPSPTRKPASLIPCKETARPVWTAVGDAVPEAVADGVTGVGVVEQLGVLEVD